MADLYAALGISRTATPEEIKSAYRAKAKATHPDHGGDPQAFQQVQMAYEVLADPDRREAYDRDGTINDARIDQTNAKALGIIEQMLAQAMQQLGPDGVVYNDVVERMREALEENRAATKRNIEDNQRAIVRLARFAKRFSVKDGKPNLLAQMVNFKIAGHEQRGREMQAGLDLHDRAAEILKDFSFEADKQPAPTNAYAWGGQQAAQGTNFANMFRGPLGP